MKTLSSGQSTAAALDGRAIIRFLKIEWPAPVGTRYYAESDVQLATGIRAAGIMQTWPECKRVLDMGIDHAPSALSASVTLRNIAEDAERLELILEQFATVAGVAVTAYLVFIPASGTLADTDWIVLQKYRIEQDPEITTRQVRLDLVEWWERPLAREVGYVTMTDGDWPKAPTGVYGRTIPLIFGAVNDVPLLLSSIGNRSTLAADIDSAETDIALESASAFAASGTIYIENEEITYSGKSSNTLTGCTRGSGGTTPVAHTAGAVVREKQSAYRYLVAWHAIKGLANVRANGRGIAGGSYTVGTTTLGGRTITILDLDAIPATAGYESAATILPMDELATWANGTGNTQADWANAVDTGDSAHVTHALLTGASGAVVLALQQTANLSGRVGQISRARVLVEYQVLGIRSGADSIAWPVSGATIEVVDGAGTLTKSLGKPPDQDINGDLEEIDLSAVIGILNSLGLTVTDSISVSASDSRALFEQTYGDVMSDHKFSVVYVSGYDFDDINTDSIDTETRLYNWLATNGLSDGDDLGFPITSTDDADQLKSAETGFYAEGEPDGSSTYTTTALRLRTPDTDDVPASLNLSSVRFKALVRNPTAGSSAVSTRLKLTIGGDDVTLSTNLAEDSEAWLEIGFSSDIRANGGADYICTQSHTSGSSSEPGVGANWRSYWQKTGTTGEGAAWASGAAYKGYNFTRAQLLAARFDIWTTGPLSSSGGLLGDQVRDKLLIYVKDIEIAAQHRPRQAGEETALSVSKSGTVAGSLTGDVTLSVDPIEGAKTVVGSSRLTQAIDITARVSAGGGWSYFNAGPLVRVNWPNTADDTLILVYNVALEVHEQAPTTTLTAEEDVELLADIEGIVDPYESPDEALHRPGNVLRYLLDAAANIGDETAFGNIGLDYLDTAALDAALADAQSAHAGWRLDRLIDQRTSIAELLFSAARDAGIRLAWEGGRFTAVPSLLVADPSDGTRELSSDYFRRVDVVRRGSSIQLMSNQVALFYQRIPDGSAQYRRTEQADDLLSQAESWGVARSTPNGNWIREDATAEALAARILADHAWRWQVVQIAGYLGWIDIELGDVLRLEDAQSGLHGQVGRVAATSMLGDDGISLSVIVSDARTRIWERAASPTTDYIDLFGSGRMLFVIGGTVVARLGLDGRLRLKGEIIEAPYSSADSDRYMAAVDSPTGLVEYASGIAFGVWNVAADHVIRAAVLDSSGNLTVAAVQENAALPLAPADSLTFTAFYQWGATAAATDWTLNKLTTSLRMARIDVGGLTNIELNARGIEENAL